MKNKLYAKIPLLLAATLVLTGCPKKCNYFVSGPYMTGKCAKKDYNAYLGSAPSTLNPTLSQNGENVTHLANLVSTLVMNDNYGILRRELASSAWHDDEYKVFEFGVRDDVPWIDSDGNIYVSGGKEQYVKPADFVETAKQVLDYDNGSQIYYMYTLFVKNAWEYRCYTEMVSKMNAGKVEDGYDWGALKTKGKQKQAEKIEEMIQKYSGHGPDQAITGDSLDDIADFKRVGVEVSNGKIRYTLRQKAQFFPTMLTYTPYMPTNSAFYKTKGKEAYGTSKENMIYCGPFRLTEFSSNTVKYAKNDKYFRRDEVHVDTVNYTVVDASTSYKEMREAFDKGEVDGFSLNPKDPDGWRDYITGPNGTGSIQHPYSDLVNSRELDDIDYTYHFVVNANRNLDDAARYEKATYWKTDAKLNALTNEGKNTAVMKQLLENTNDAMKISEVRKLVLDGLDINVYNENNELDDPNQYQINTFTPKGYVFDEYSTDYIEYYYREYAEQKGLTGDGFDGDPVAEAKSLVGPQQISGVQYLEETDATRAFLEKYPWLNLTNVRENAIQAINSFNEHAYEGKHIDYPVLIDYHGSKGLSSDLTQWEDKLVRTWNERANGCTLRTSGSGSYSTCPIGSSGEPEYPYFKMVNSALTEQSTATSYAENGYYTLGQWGWVGDYADPLTYMHCYHTNGEMSQMSGNTEPIKNYQLSGTDLQDAGYIFEDYNAMVETASDIDSPASDRFDAFASAEYVLLNELNYIKPSAMQSQGWAVSVSRACGYENPTSPYGLASHSLIGIWVLVDVPTGQERQECRDLQARLKEEAMEACGRNTINPIYE